MTAPNARGYGKIMLVDGPAADAQPPVYAIAEPGRAPDVTIVYSHGDNERAWYFLWPIVDNRSGTPVEHWFYSVLHPAAFGEEQPPAEVMQKVIDAKNAEWGIETTTGEDGNGTVIRTDETQEGQ